MARELAGRPDITLEQWVAAARTLPLRRDEPATVDGRNRLYRTRLEVLGAERKAEIHVRVPADAERPGPLPLLFVWHAAGGDGAQALATWTPLADRFGFLLAAPTETEDDYRRDGWSYHPDGYQGLFAALRFVRRNFDVDEDRIVLAGVRGGGHMAWDVGLRCCDRFAALIPANGAPRLGNAPRENNLTFVESIAHVPIRIVRWGDVEAMQTANIQRAIELLRGFGNQDVKIVTGSSEADCLAGTAAGWDSFLGSRRRVPARLVRYADLAWTPPIADWGRCHWLEIQRTDGKQIEWPPKVPAQWSRLDEQGRRNWLDGYLREHTPRLQASMTAPGRFEVEDRGIERFRLLLTGAMVGGGTVVVKWRGHVLEKPAVPATITFLLEFAERFDRTFLPTAAVVLP
jgi:poly(3-hydroxybutyrate) depolymerase